MRVKWVVKRISLLVVSTLAALLVAESVLRVLRPDLGWYSHEEPSLGWASEEYLEFDPLEATDENAGGPGERRMLFLGDSFLAGVRLRHLDERFPVLVGNEIPGVRAQILASGGWGTDQQLIAFLQKGRYWRPDLVVLCFCPNNDISNLVSNSHGNERMMKPYFVLADDGTIRLFDPRGHPMPLATIGPVRSREPVRIHLVDWVSRTLLRWQPEPPPQYPDVDSRYQEFLRVRESAGEIYELRPALSWSPQDGVNHVSAYIHEDFPLNSYQWHLFRRILTMLDEAVTAAGGKLLVMLLPASFHARDTRFVAGGKLERGFATPTGRFTFRAAEPAERLAAICAGSGIAFFDPSADFIRTIDENRLAGKCWPDARDRHFSATGHRILADLLIEYLGKESLERSGARASASSARSEGT